MNSLLKDGDALLIVDAQLDFFPGGALPVPEGDKIIPVINKWIKEAQKNNIPIFASRDWHPQDHCSFKVNGGIWPVHCVQYSRGASLHPDIQLPSDATIVNKAFKPHQEAYSAFQGRNVSNQKLDQVMKLQGIKRIWINGLALDYCIVASALEARKLGYEVHLLLEGTQAIKHETGQEALKKMKEAGVLIEK